MKATRRRHGWVHMFSTHRRTLTIQLHNFDLFRTCHTSSFCAVVWQLARFQLTRRIARSLGDSWASCIPLGMQYPGIDALRIKRRKNRLSGFGSIGVRKIWVTKKGKLKTTRQWHFAHMSRRLQWGDHFEFWHVRWYRRRNHPTTNFVSIGSGVSEFWHPQFSHSP